MLAYDHKKADYEIEDTPYIYDTIWKIVGQPENEKLIEEFNDFIENEKKVLNKNLLKRCLVNELIDRLNEFGQVG